MCTLVRILAVVFLVAYGAGSGAHAAAVTDMSLKMAIAAVDDGGMADCQDCPGDNPQASACDQFCMTTLTAICPPSLAELEHAPAPASLRSTEPFDGRIGPPDLHPPRNSFLS